MHKRYLTLEAYGPRADLLDIRKDLRDQTGPPVEWLIDENERLRVRFPLPAHVQSPDLGSLTRPGVSALVSLQLTLTLPALPGLNPKKTVWQWAGQAWSVMPPPVRSHQRLPKICIDR